MRHKKIIAALAALCLCASSPTAAFAATVISGTDADRIGPGFENLVDEENDKSDVGDMAWTKVDGVYVDNTGKPIEGAILRGISVSKWQGTIDWGKVAADDVAFAMIRMASIGYEGEYTVDETFDRNMREAKANGVHTAPYIYLQTRTVEEAREAAQYAADTARNYDVTYPITVDIESQYLLDFLSVQELTDVVNAFCQVIAENGYTPMVYSDYNKFTTEMDTSQIPYDIWLARYGTDNWYANRTIWQSTDQGKIDGISGNVCLEFAFKDYAPSQGASDEGRTIGTWNQEDGSWYFYDNGGRMSGWIKPDGKWYYLDPANGGIMVSNVTMTIDGVSYTFDGSGALVE